MARGHKIENVPEMPLVVSDSAEAVEKTSAAIKVLVYSKKIENGCLSRRTTSCHRPRT
jgi:hypothetical protein